MGFLGSVGKVFKSAFTAPLDIATLGAFSGSWTGKSQQDDANRQAMKAWTLANDYNHPVAQMERLRQAGLNPLLVYGSGSVAGNTTGAPSLVGGGISTPTEGMFKGLGSILGAVQGYANLQNTRAQTQASTASAGASQAQASNLQAQATAQETRNEFLERTLIADLDYKEAQTRLANAQTAKTSAEADITQGEANLFGAVGGAKGAGAIGKGASTGLRLLRGVLKK